MKTVCSFFGPPCIIKQTLKRIGLVQCASAMCKTNTWLARRVCCVLLERVISEAGGTTDEAAELADSNEEKQQFADVNQPNNQLSQKIGKPPSLELVFHILCCFILLHFTHISFYIYFCAMFHSLLCFVFLLCFYSAI